MHSKPELTEQILGLYIGRPCDFSDISGTEKDVILTHGLFYNWRNGSIVSLTLHLRRLESITEEECRFIYKMNRQNPIDDKVSYKSDWWDRKDLWDFHTSDVYLGEPSVWLYLLSKGFDLFDFICAGLAKEVSE